MINDHLTELKNTTIKLSSPQEQTYTLTLNSPAVAIMTDFNKVKAVTTEPTTSAVKAMDIMKANRVNSLLVMNKNDEFIGIISSRILGDHYILEYMTKYGVKSRDEVQVQDLMLKKSQVHAMDIKFLVEKKYTIKDVIDVLSKLHERHIIITTQHEGENGLKIIGIISAVDISRALGISFDESLESTTFSNLMKYINI